MTPCVSDIENLELCKIPAPQEIKKGGICMAELKSPSLDSFLVLFYKKYFCGGGVLSNGDCSC